MAILVLLLLLETAPPARSEDLRTSSLRYSNHHAFGRIELDVPRGTWLGVERAPGRVILRLHPSGTIAVPGNWPRNVQTLTTEGGQATVVLTDGAHARIARVGNRLFIDTLDPKPTLGAAQAPTLGAAQGAARGGAQAATQMTAATPVRTAPPDRHDTASYATTPTPASGTAPISPVASTPLPPPVAAASPLPTRASTPSPADTPSLPALATAGQPLALRVDKVASPDGQSAIAVPFGAGTGAAAFRRGGDAVVVFDEARPLDLSALADDPVFGTASVRVLPDATVLLLALPPERALSLARSASGWTVTVVAADTPPPARPIVGAPDGRSMRLAAPGPGRVVAVRDPAGDDALLVGTLHDAGAAVPVARATPMVDLPATWLGVAVVPLSDRIGLRAIDDGFTIDADRGELALSASSGDLTPVVVAASMTRSFDLPNLPPAELLRRMQTETDDAAAAPALARSAARLKAAQTMLALGFDAEAAALLRLAVAEDPRLDDDATATALRAVAALLAGRMDETDALAGPAPPATDELALWRALRAASADEPSPGAAQVIAATLPLVLSYPPTLRDRILPRVAETLALGGEVRAADALLVAFPDRDDLLLARGLVASAKGQTDVALGAFDTAARSRDRLVHVRAARRAVELRLASHRIDAAEAARQLDPLIAGWRGDDRERLTRMRIASLQAEAGAPANGLRLLRETEAMWPDDSTEIRGEMRSIMDAVLHGHTQPLAPLALASLVEDNADLLPLGPGGTAATALLADQLAALDLTAEAAPLVERVMQASPAGPARAALGAQLASLRLDDHDWEGATAALAASEPPPSPRAPDAATTADAPTPAPTPAPALPSGLAERRALLTARALAGAGNPQAASATLALVGTRDAAALRADILESARDWPAAVGALSDLAKLDVPKSGTLSAAQARVLLRLAGAAAKAGDDAALARVRQQGAGRMGADDNLFRLITAPEVRDVGDLPRAAAEASLARTVISALATSAPAAH